jgi:hypothetical protein
MFIVMYKQRSSFHSHYCHNTVKWMWVIPSHMGELRLHNYFSNFNHPFDFNYHIHVIFPSTSENIAYIITYWVYYDYLYYDICPVFNTSLWWFQMWFALINNRDYNETRFAIIKWIFYFKVTICKCSWSWNQRKQAVLACGCVCFK